MSKSPITCHVLDSSTGKPAVDVVVRLETYPNSATGTGVFEPLARGVTNTDGRCLDLLPPSSSADAIPLVAGQIYKVVFEVKEYFAKTDRKCFYPWVEIPFTLENPAEHYHIPLLISPFSFTTYRGS